VTVLRAPFVLLWKVWFYVAIFWVIVFISPFILLYSRKPTQYQRFFPYAVIWARAVLALIGTPIRVIESTKFPPAPYIIVANHTSMLDILCTLAVVPDTFLFIGKVELTRLPIFGYFYKRTNILVDRSSIRSRKQAFHQAEERIEEGISICIYPEGGVPEHDVLLDRFKDGAFRLALQKDIPIVPITFVDNKRAFPYKAFLGGPRPLRVRIGEGEKSKGRTTVQWRDDIRELFLKNLEPWQ
jgi:1-acyl-sn-glycerol-3-phosphate acyltransferase